MKKIKKLMSIILLALLFIEVIPVSIYANSLDKMSNYQSNSLLETTIYYDSINKFRITYEYNKDIGTSIVRGYDNNVLIEEDYIYDSDSDNIYINKYAETRLNKNFRPIRINNFSAQKYNNQTHIIPIDTIIQSNGSHDNTRSFTMFQANNSSRYLGQLKVSLKRTSQTFNFSVTEMISNPYQATYTINSYVGSLVTLAAGHLMYLV